MNGKFLDGWSLAECAVQVALVDDRLQIVDSRGALLRSWSLDELEIDGMQEGDAYHLTHGSAQNEQLALHDPALVRELLARTRRAAILPGGELLLLERKFSLRGGAGIRIRRIPLAQIAPGALVDGPTLLEADLGFEIDNFEGLDVHQTPDGETVLTLISDDNFSMLQRTILLQFALVE